MRCGQLNPIKMDNCTECGQAMILGLMLIGLGMLTWSASYYIGNLVHDKISLIRATDAAALSAATTQARFLNFHAYLNRAQLANQLAMLHLVTLASHERFRSTQALQSMGMNPPAFLIGMFFGPSYAASYLASQAGGVSDGHALLGLETAFRKHDLVIEKMLEQTRRVLLQEMSISRNQILERVLINNIGDSGSIMRGPTLVELGVSYTIKRDVLKDNIRYLSTQSPVWGSALRQVIEPYGYLKPRNDVRQNIWAVNIRCPHKRHELRRRGHSSHHPDGTYASEDTVSFHAIRSNRAIGCYQREYPMGWAQIKAVTQGAAWQQDNQISGSAQADVSAGQNFSSEPFWQWVKKQGNASWDIFNGSSNKLAQSWSSSQKISWQSRANAGFADVLPGMAEFHFELNASQNAKSLSAHSNKAVFAGSFKTFGLEEKDLIAANATSITYFSRPAPREDGRHEYPSLFHPYWHARLVSR